MKRLSLRARLLLGVILLATVGLSAVHAVTYPSLRTFLLQRVDDTLAAADESVALQVPGLELQQDGAVDARSLVQNLAIPGQCIQLRKPNGVPLSMGSPPPLPNQAQSAGKTSSSVLCLPQLAQTPVPPPPRLPARISLRPPPLGSTAESVSFFDVPAVTGSGSYRVRASIGKSDPQFMVVIATPLAAVQTTLHRLLVIELLVTAVVLIALATLGLWVVRFGLRPLEEIGKTAAAIAGGDLSQRVEHVDQNTEVGRLGAVLNAMLSQIESAFRSREATEQKLRRFVADASHELRTPLAAIRAYAELFSRGAAERPDDLERLMHGIIRESERMGVLVDELIVLAQLDEFGPGRHEAVDLESVVVESVEVAQAVEPERPFAVESEHVVVDGDPDGLRQLVDNLLTNVRAHTPADAAVRVVLRRVNGNAVLQVADSGPGLNERDMSHIFERFYRADVSRSRARGGAGLGLAIVAAQAEAHGGSAAVQSEQGKGATFTITLPLSEEAAAPDPPLPA